MAPVPRPSTTRHAQQRRLVPPLPHPSRLRDLQIGRIEPADIRIFVADLVEKGLAPSTVAAVYRVLARILATAEIDGVIARTPCRGIKLPRQTTSTEPCFLSPAEVRRLAEPIEDATGCSSTPPPTPACVGANLPDWVSSGLIYSEGPSR